MKKTILFFLCVVLMACVAACGNSKENAPTQESEVQKETVEESAEKLETEEESDELEVKKDLFDVIIEVPADFVGEATQEELDAAAAAAGYEIKLNEDGSASYKMTKEQHDQMMEETKRSIDDSLAMMIGSEEYPNFVKIEPNEDYTSFTITTKSKELDMSESFSTIGFFMYGGMYNVFNGTPKDDIYVEFVNADSGEIISSSNSKE